MNEEDLKIIEDSLIHWIYFINEAETKRVVGLLLKEYKEQKRELVEAKEANRQLSLELEKKDKIIDLLVNELYLFNAIDCDYKEFKDNKCLLKPSETNEKKCKQCIKQYFEKKVR